MLEKEIILARPRGFCAGVDRAISIVEEAIRRYGTPIYVKHQIVHNKFVVSELEKKGAIFIEDLESVPIGSRLIFSAHGVSPQIKKKAESRNLKILDATCPLVTKVHKEALRYAREEYQIILIGHQDHVEVEGTYGHAPDKITLVSTVEDAKNLTFPQDTKLAYITQTTLSVDDTSEIIAILKQKYKTIKDPPKGDICYATTNRQNAVKQLAKDTDIILVIGANNSSNTLRLVEVAENLNTPAHRIEDAQELNFQWFENVKKIGITSGASAPEVLVQNVINKINNEFQCSITELVLTTEKTVFPLPLALRS